jgi:hypothetical protein
MKQLLFVLVMICLMNCAADNKNETKTNFVFNSSPSIPEKNSSEEMDDRYDSLFRTIDTSTLEGKRNLIKSCALLYLCPGFTYDTLFDLNYDGFGDYVINNYGCAGTGLKAAANVYLYNPKFKGYQFSNKLSPFVNPSFYINQKKISSFYLANGGGWCVLWEWKDKEWIVTKEIYVDNNGDSTRWEIRYPVKNDSAVIIMPYQMIPPSGILETSLKWN